MTARPHDKIVTTFCKPVTTAARENAIPIDGQGEVAGVGSHPARRRRSAVAAVALALAAGCSGRSGAPRAPGGSAPAKAVAPEAAPAVAPAVAPEVARYYAGYVAEVIDGDARAAEAAYREVARAPDPLRAPTAARAALRLAQLEAWRGNRREAVELVARAQAVGGNDRALLARADQLQDDIALVTGGGAADVRGPPLGAQLPGVSPDAAALFARAETLASAFYRVDVRPRIEDPQAGDRARLRAAEAAMRAYGAVIDLGEPAATVAAEFRIGSLYHDLALALVAELPAELSDRRAIARLRQQQAARSGRYLRAARAAYRRSLATEETPAGRRWRRAAAAALASVEVLLAGAP
ncbi:MAG: hypothetical protein D6689_06650 [Deltaproteobacteria bacterium]|nr:MAG: hypothetical protein D6689_06650 [Deltaproteobacteria bacterium]